MKRLLFVALLLWASLSVRADEVKEEQEVKPPPQEEKAEPSVAAVGRQVRFGYCPRGWDDYGGRCYRVVNSKRTWTQARNYCARLQSRLASAHDVTEYDFLRQITRLRAPGGTNAWIGAFYFQNQWAWDDGTEYDYTNWWSLNSASSYPCVYLYTGAGWANSLCGTSYPFICMKSFDNC